MFYPSLGRCYEPINLQLAEKVQFIMSLGKVNKTQIFLTDKKLRIKNGIHFQSHWGSRIFITYGWETDHVIKLSKLSNFDPRIILRKVFKTLFQYSSLSPTRLSPRHQPISLPPPSQESGHSDLVLLQTQFLIYSAIRLRFCCVSRFSAAT